MRGPVHARMSYLPIALAGVLALTGVCTFSISIAVQPWWFGYGLPMFSFTGYDPPIAWWIFSIGLTTAGALCIATGYAVFRWVEAVRTAVGLTTHGRSNRACLACMIFAAVNLAALAWTNHRTFYRSGNLGPHVGTTLLAFGGWLGALRLNYTCVRAALEAAGAHEPSSPLVDMLRSALTRKRRGLQLLATCLLLHVPVGYVAPLVPLCGAPRRGCLARLSCAMRPERCIPYEGCPEASGLTQAQCVFWRQPGNASLTGLARQDDVCEACAVLSPLAAVTQYLVIASLTGLLLSFYFDLVLDPFSGEAVDKAGKATRAKLPPAFAEVSVAE